MAIAGLLLAGCRADSFTSPQAADCTGEPGCNTTPLAPIDPEVYAALDDAVLRLVPTITGAATPQASLAGSLQALSHALKARRAADARIALADVYVQLAPFRVTRGDGTEVDPPDVSAVRLALVPAANALAVQIK